MKTKNYAESLGKLEKILDEEGNTMIRTRDLLMEQKIVRTCALAGEDGQVCWSNDAPIPEVGEKVNVTMNSIGTGTLLAYALIHDFIALIVDVDEPPEWLEKNYRDYDNDLSIIYGAEVEIAANQTKTHYIYIDYECREKRAAYQAHDGTWMYEQCNGDWLPVMEGTAILSDG